MMNHYQNVAASFAVPLLGQHLWLLGATSLVQDHFLSANALTNIATRSTNGHVADLLLLMKRWSKGRFTPEVNMEQKTKAFERHFNWLLAVWCGELVLTGTKMDFLSSSQGKK